MTSQDENNLRLLAIFHYVCAGIAALCASIPVIHLVIGLLIALWPEAMGAHGERPPVLIGWIFVFFAALFILLGWTFAALLAWAGRCLSVRRHYSYCFVMACVSCVFMPFGTVLGVFTILVLKNPAVKAAFSGQAQLAA